MTTGPFIRHIIEWGKESVRIQALTLGLRLCAFQLNLIGLLYAKAKNCSQFLCKLKEPILHPLDLSNSMLFYFEG